MHNKNSKKESTMNPVQKAMMERSVFQKATPESEIPKADTDNASPEKYRSVVEERVLNEAEYRGF